MNEKMAVVRPRVYLAGGMRTEWRSQVKARLGDRVDFFDPTTHGLKDERLYTAWDVDHVDLCDILFGFLEADNPSGYGLMLEIGYAAARNKIVIFANEKREMDRYCGMARQLSFCETDNLDEAINALVNLVDNECQGVCGV